MHNRILLYSFIGLITLASLGGVQAYSLFQNLCFPLANGTPCINWTGSQYEWTNISIAGDGNNYPTTLSVNQTEGNYTIQLGRNGLSTLQANFVVNSTGGASGGGITGVTINNGTGINVSGNGTTFTIGVANLQACNSVTEYSVWNGSHWLCDNDGQGTTYTFNNTDGLVNLSGSPSLIINLNITAMDLRYTLKTLYDAFTAAIYSNVTATQAAISVLQAFDTAIYTNVTALQNRPTGNITGSGVTNYVARWTNSTNIGTGSITDTTSLVTINSTINLITPTNSNYESLVIFSNETTGGSNNGKIRFEGYGVNGYNKIEFNPEEATSPGSTKVLFNVHNRNWVDNATHQHFSIYTTNTTDSLVKRFDLQYNKTTSDADFSNSNLNLYDGNFAVVEGNASIGAINPASSQRLYIYEPNAGAVAMRIDRGSPNYVSFVTPSGSPSVMEVRVSSTDTPSYNMYVSDGGIYYKGDMRFRQNVHVDKNLSINGSANISVITYTPELCLNGDCRTSWPTGNITGSGNTNYVARWTNSTNLEASSINQIGNNTYLLGDLNVLGRNSTTDGNYTMINLFNIGIVNDTNGASSRMQLNFWNGSINANNRLYSITAHDRINSTTEHPSHISHYALLKNNSYAAKFMEVLIGTDTDRKIYLGSNEDTSYIDRIVFPESVTGFYSNETDRRKGIESVASQYVILLDSDGDQSTDSFLLAQNNEDTVIIGTDNNRRVGINTLTPSFPLQVLANGSGEQKAFGLFNNQITTGSAVSMVFGISSSATYSNEAGMITVNRTNSPTSGDADMIFKIRTSGTTTDVMTIDSMARVGINTTSPSQLLEVIGNANITGILYAPEICLNNECRSSWSSSGTYGNLSADQATNGQVAIFNNQTQVNGSQLYYNFSSGRFGVATITPQQRMEVVTNSNTDYSMIRRSSTSANDVASLGFAVTTSSSGTTPQAIISYNRTNSPTSGDGDITFSSRFNAAVNEVFRIKSDSRVGVNTSSPTQTLHVQGGANITGIIYTPQLCLNGDCRTSWPSGGAGGGNFSEFRVSNSTSTTTLYNNSLLTIQAGSNVVVDQTAGTFTISASVTGGSGNVSGNGTTSRLALWNSANTIVNSSVYENSNNIQINKTNALVNGNSFDRTGLNYFYPLSTEFCDSTVNNGGTGGGFVGGTISSGLIAFVPQALQQVNHPCINTISDSTTANGGAFFSAGPNDGLLLNGSEETRMIFKTYSGGTKGNITIRFGFSDSSTITQPVDGVYMEFNMSMTPNPFGTNTLQAWTSSNSVRSSNATTYTFSNATWYIASVSLNDNGNTAYYKLYNESGTLLWNTTLSTNIPTGANRMTAQKVIATQASTDSGAVILNLDYMDFTIKRPIRNIVLTG